MPNSKQPAAKDCVFTVTHEPCSLCLSTQDTLPTS